MMPRAEAETAVRRGQLAAFLAIKPGFGAGSQRMFYGPPREIEVGADPVEKGRSRHARGPVDAGRGRGHAADALRPHGIDGDGGQCALAMRRVTAAAPRELVHFLGELKTFVGSPASQREAAAGGSEWQPLKIVSAPIARERSGPRNPFEITFPQGVIWGLIGCAMSFGLSLVSERTQGHVRPALAWRRSRAAQILGGKALACFVAMVIVQTLLYAMGVTLLRGAAGLVAAAAAGLALRRPWRSSAS